MQQINMIEKGEVIDMKENSPKDVPVYHLTNLYVLSLNSKGEGKIKNTLLRGISTPTTRIDVAFLSNSWKIYQEVGCVTRFCTSYL